MATVITITTTNMVTVMTTAVIHMPDSAPLADPTLLQLMWLASPALPVGGFSYSEGLESAVEQGHVADEAQATDWLVDQMLLSQSRADWAIAAAAHTAWENDDPAELNTLNNWLLQTRESAEMRLQTEQTGRSLLEWLRNGAQSADPRIVQLAQLRPAPSWPLAFALATVLAGATQHQALQALAFGWAENMAQSAIKAVPLGQAGAQRLLGRLVELIPQAIEQAICLPAAQRQSHAPMLAILSAQHEIQYSRLFRS